MRRAGWTMAWVLGAGLLLASNTGFFLEYPLLGPEDSASGTNWISLPYNTEPQTAQDMFSELGGATMVESVARFDPQSDNNQTFSGAPEDDFSIVPGEGLIVKMKSTVDYAFVGSHRSGASVTLLGPEDSISGLNLYALPYHAQASSASELQNDINQSCNGDCVIQIERLIRSNDSMVSYSGSAGGGPDFPLTAGESYRIQVNQTVEFVLDVVE